MADKLYIGLSIIILLGICVCTPTTYDEIQSMRSVFGTINIVAPLNSATTTTQSFTFNPIFTTSSTITYIATGIIGFQSPKSIDFNLLIMSTQSSLSPTFLINVTVYGTMVLSKIKISYIIALDIFEIFSQCFNCSTLNNGSGLRNEKRSMKTKFTSGKLAIISFFYGFNSTNTQGLLISLIVKSNQIPYSQTIQSIFTTQQYNIIQSVCYTVLIYNTQQFSLRNYNYHFWDAGSIEYSNITSGRFINFSPRMDRYTTPDNTNRMFFAVSGFRLSNFQTKQFNLDTTQYNNFDVNYISKVQTNQVKMSYFMAALAVCTTGRYYDVVNKDCILSATCTARILHTQSTKWCGPCHYTCLTCNSPSVQCLTCQPSNFRTIDANNQCACDTGYVDISLLPACQLCYTYIPRCIACKVSKYAVQCTDCGIYLLANNSCRCQTGLNFVTDTVCVNTSGCIGYIPINSTLGKCTLCNTTNHQPLNATFQCSCKSGYMFNGLSCIIPCGNGVLESGEQCDDGNLINGDGCSSSCVIQIYWTCNTTVSPSICTKASIPIPQQPILTLGYVVRVTNQNKMRVGVVVVPSDLPFSSTTLNSLITHNIPSNSYQASYSNGMMVIDFDYNRTIEDDSYVLQFTPSLTYPNITANLTIPAIGMNTMLTYDSYCPNIIPLSILILILDCLVIFILFFSLMSERLIGIELMLTVQSIFYLMSFLKKTPNALSPLFNLRYSNGYNYELPNRFTRTYYIGSNAWSLGIDKQFLLSFNVMYVLLLTCLSTMLIMRIVKSCYQRGLQSSQYSHDEMYQKLKLLKKIINISNFIFDRVYPVFGFMTLFTILFAFSIQIRDYPGFTQLVLYQPADIIAAIIAVVLSLVFVILFLFPKLFSFSSIKSQYPSRFAIYQLIFITCVSMGSQIYGIVVIMALVIVKVITILKWKPYSQRIHQLSIVYHQVIIFIQLLLFFYIVLSNYSHSQMLYLIGCYIIIILLYVAAFLNVYRLYSWKIQSHQQQVETQEITEVQKNIKPHQQAKGDAKMIQEITTHQKDLLISIQDKPLFGQRKIHSKIDKIIQK